jgi:carboxyl-terminal processing protease
VPQLSDPDEALKLKYGYRESDLKKHLVNEASLKDDDLENDAKPDPRFTKTAAQLKKEGIDDFQLHYALQTLGRTANIRTAQR